jgi:hypothetical protein
MAQYTIKTCSFIKNLHFDFFKAGLTTPIGVEIMNNVSVCLDHKRYRSKPDKYETAEISAKIGKRVKSYSGEKMDCFVQDVLAGQTFCPATFKNGFRKKDGFDQMQMFVLDIDKGISYS